MNSCLSVHSAFFNPDVIWGNSARHSMNTECLWQQMLCKRISENKADVESDNILNGIINNLTFLSISSMRAFHFVCKIAAKDWRTGQNEDENC